MDSFSVLISHSTADDGHEHRTHPLFDSEVLCVCVCVCVACQPLHVQSICIKANTHTHTHTGQEHCLSLTLHGMQALVLY